jgi:hypothetical protein
MNGAKNESGAKNMVLLALGVDNGGAINSAQAALNLDRKCAG